MKIYDTYSCYIYAKIFYSKIKTHENIQFWRIH